MRFPCTTHPHRLHEFGARRAIRMAAARKGVPFGQAERVVLASLDQHGDRGAAVLAGLAALRGDPLSLIAEAE